MVLVCGGVLRYVGVGFGFEFGWDALLGFWVLVGF